MNVLAILATAVVVASGAPPADALTSPPQFASVGATDPAARDDERESLAEELAADGMELVDEGVLAAELSAGGVEVVDVTESEGVADLALASEDGAGETVESRAVVDLIEGSASLGVVLPDGTTGAYDLVIDELSDSKIAFTISDPATGQTADVSSLVGDGAIAPALVLGIPLALQALQALFAAGAVVIVAGVIWIAATEAIRAINNGRTNHNHYAATIASSGALLIGQGLTVTQARHRMEAALNTWSRSKAGAKQVCQLASGGRQPVGPEIDRHGSGKFEHYHRSTRSAAHCFFGNPRP